MQSNRTISSSAAAPAPRSSRLRPGLGLAAALLFTACDDPGPDPDAAPEAEAAQALEVELPSLTPQEIAALRAERSVASLPVDRAGSVEIVNSGTAEAPAYVYIAVGGPLLNDVLRQLVDEQGATPAEVHLALADGDPLPEALAADHRARAEQDPAVSARPRRLAYVTPRSITSDDRYCLGSGGNPENFGDWLGDWEQSFGTYFNPSYQYDDINMVDGGTAYTIAADSNGRVMSSCNAAHNDVMVSFWSLTFIPGLYYPYSFVWAENLEDFDAVHLHSNGAGPLYRMGVSHSHPDPKTYVAYGRCGGAC